MCGIVVARHDWLIRQGLAAETAMRDAVAALAWRGPDGQGVVRCGSWWLGCARLAISRADSTQPVARTGGRLAAVMNGAISNARQLWGELNPRIGEQRYLVNDTWLPLRAVESQQELLHAFEGHHAYAVVDAKRDELWFGQDHYGQKPLHCLIERHGSGWRLVAAASTRDALRRVGMPAYEPDDRRIAEWFRFGWSTDRAHEFSDGLRLTSVRQRGRAHRTTNDSSDWCEVADIAPANKPPVERISAWERVTQLVGDHVTCSLGTPFALSLSGGIDSTVLASALDVVSRDKPAYHFHAKGTPTAERDTARRIAMSRSLEFRLVKGGPELLDHLATLTRLAGQPLGDPSILAAHAIARQARDDGIRVLLGGDGADELMLGYRRYQLLARLPAIRRMPGLRWLDRFSDDWSQRYRARAVRAAVAANPIRSLLAVTPPAFGQHVLAPDLAAQPCWHDAEELPPWRDSDELLQLAQRDDLENYLPRDLLPKIDIATMAAGIECRSPFLETDFELTPSRKNVGKLMLRDMLAGATKAAGRLPKTGFAVPLNDWFRRNLPSLDLLAEPRSRERRHLRPGGLERAIDVHRSGKADLGHGLYLLLAYELYLRSIESTDQNESSSS